MSRWISRPQASGDRARFQCFFSNDRRRCKNASKTLILTRSDRSETSSPDSNPSRLYLNPKLHTTQITKHCWDWLLLPIAAISVIAAVAIGAFTGFWRGLEVPALTLGLWAYLRYTTPRAGTPAVSINGNPKVKALLKWLAFIMLITIAWAVVDTHMLGNSIDTPLTGMRIAGLVAMVSLLLVGAFVIEWRYPAPPKDTKTGG